MDDETDLNYDVEQEIQDSDQASTGPTITEKDVRYYACWLLMILGLSLIALFITLWIQNVFVQQRVGDQLLRSDYADQLLWRALASGINTQYVYAIVGLILCLLAIHLRGRRSWYAILPFLLLFAALNAVFLVVGFLGLVFVLNWGEFWGSYYVSSFLYLMKFLIEASALIAILVLEMPMPRWNIRKMFARTNGSFEDAEDVALTDE